MIFFLIKDRTHILELRTELNCCENFLPMIANINFKIDCRSEIKCWLFVIKARKRNLKKYIIFFANLSSRSGLLFNEEKGQVTESLLQHGQQHNINTILQTPSSSSYNLNINMGPFLAPATNLSGSLISKQPKELSQFGHP